MDKTDEQVEHEYMISQGLRSVDVGSVPLLRREINRKIVKKGYRKLKGYKPKKQLFAINKNI